MAGGGMAELIYWGQGTKKKYGNEDTKTGKANLSR